MTASVVSFGFGNIEQLVNPVQDDSRFSSRYELYSGEVELLFDADAHSYFVRKDGQEPIRVPGVTSITGTLDKPALAPWSAKMCAEAIISAMEGHSYQAGERRRIFDTDFEQFVEMVQFAKGEHRRISQDALDIGHLAHEYLENIQKRAINNQTTIHGVWDSGQPPLPVVPADTQNVDEHLAKLRMDVAVRHTEATQNCCKAAVNWMIKHNYRPLRVENKIYSRMYNYAGTFDGVALIDSCEDGDCCSVVRQGGRVEHLSFKNWLVVADWKSSKGMYTEYRFQTAAYVVAWLEEHGHEIADIIREVLGEVDFEIPTTIQGRVVVKLGKDTGDVEAFILVNDYLDKDFAAFLGLTTPYERLQEIEESERMARNLESSIKKAERAERDAAEALRKAQARALRQAESENKKREEEAAKALKQAEKLAAKAAKEQEKQLEKEAKEALKAAKKAEKELVQ